ncbi:MAG TPA: type II CAAX endopeptidase family protein [Opitutaceae bacterium]|nr:type II CAAX endopeptidase family protein [Opitutaceae bacterium]
MTRPRTNSVLSTFLIFVAGAVLLRLASIAGWVFFPGDGSGVRLARIAIPTVFTIGLVWLNDFALRRDGWPRDSLGLRPTASRAGWFLVGAGAMTVIVSLLVAALWCQVHFHLEPGSMTWRAFGWRSAEYLAGNFGEELIFRGYLLLTLAKRWGDARAVLVTSFLFGLFHLPGLSGIVALKMVCTTFLGGCLFARVFLSTRTLWTAVAMHVAGNIVLHHVYGASAGSDAASWWKPVFDSPWPSSYDPAFVAWLIVLIPVIAAAAFLRRPTPAA